MREGRWRCECPICRIIVYPILDRITKITIAQSGRDSGKKCKEKREAEKASSESGAEGGVEQGKDSATETPKNVIEEKIKKYPVEVIKLGGGTQSIQQKQQVIQSRGVATVTLQNLPALGTQRRQESSNKAQERHSEESGGGSVRIEIPKQVIEKIEALESEINKIKKYVKANIDGIKATLVDLRSIMTELSNPFNILRKYADIFFEGKGEKKLEEEKKEQHQQPQPQMIVYPVIMPSQPFQYPQQMPQAQPSTEAKSKGAKSSVKLIDIGDLGDVVTWINRALDKVSVEHLDKIISTYVGLGVMTETTGDALKNLTRIINELRKLGLSVNEQVMILTGLFGSGDGKSVSKEPSQNRGEAGLMSY